MKNFLNNLKYLLLVLFILIFVSLILGYSITTLILSAALVVLVKCSYTDIRHKKIPNIYIIILFFIGCVELLSYFIFSTAIYTNVFDSIIGCLFFPSLLFAISIIFKILFRRECIGMGDIKAISAIGFIIGWKYQFVFMVFTSFLTLIVGVLGSIKHRSLNIVLPVAPFMLVSLLLTICIIGIMNT